ncbi:MAG: hypothetical protein ACRD2D_13510 [Terriglobales bacterium]
MKDGGLGRGRLRGNDYGQAGGYEQQQLDFSHVFLFPGSTPDERQRVTRVW